MNGRFLFGMMIVIVVIAIAVGVGAYAYNAGVAQGLIESGKLTTPAVGVAPAPGIAPFVYPGRYVYHPFWTGLLSCLVPFLFVFMIFGLMRAMIWRGHWGHHGHFKHWDKGVPPPFEEWHRKLHEQQDKPQEASAA